MEEPCGSTGDAKSLEQVERGGDDARNRHGGGPEGLADRTLPPKRINFVGTEIAHRREDRNGIVARHCDQLDAAAQAEMVQPSAVELAEVAGRAHNAIALGEQQVRQ